MPKARAGSELLSHERPYSRASEQFPGAAVRKRQTCVPVPPVGPEAGWKNSLSRTHEGSPLFLRVQR